MIQRVPGRWIMYTQGQIMLNHVYELANENLLNDSGPRAH